MRLRLLAFISMFVLLGLVNLASPCVAQDRPTDVTPLTPSKTIEQEISGGQAQSFSVTLKQGQFLRAVATSHDIDVVVMLYGPDGQKLLTVDLLKYSKKTRPTLSLRLRDHHVILPTWQAPVHDWGLQGS